jgi:hypothetical protein
LDFDGIEANATLWNAMVFFISLGFPRSRKPCKQSKFETRKQKPKQNQKKKTTMMRHGDHASAIVSRAAGTAAHGHVPHCRGQRRASSQRF